MRISVTGAKGQLTELVRRAEAGEEVVLTRHGRDAIRFAPIKPVPVQSLDERRRLLDSVQAAAAVKATAGASAARSQDFLYDDDGLPV
jgi:prevent-host-death family protein